MPKLLRIHRECLALAHEGDHQTVIMIQPGSKITLVTDGDQSDLVEAVFSNQKVYLQSKDIAEAELLTDSIAVAAAEATA